MDAKLLQQAGEPEAFVSGFQEDVFISYLHMDNEADQCVSKLQTRLKGELESILGNRVRFWCDRNVGGADILDTTLRRRIAASAVFLPVLSPSYGTYSGVFPNVKWHNHESTSLWVDGFQSLISSCQTYTDCRYSYWPYRTAAAAALLCRPPGGTTPDVQ